MPEDEDLELDQLLARGRLSGRQYDEIERRVLGQVAPKRRRWVWNTLLPAAALVSAAATFVVFLGHVPSPQPSAGLPVTPRENEFTARGSSVESGAAAPVLDLGCAGRPPHVCRVGDTLMFSVNGSQSAGYLFAFAERVADAPGRIWYFPASDGTAPSVEARASTSVLSRGVRLGPPHAVGKYRVSAWLSAEPATEARALEQSHQVHLIPLALEIVE